MQEDNAEDSIRNFLEKGRGGEPTNFHIKVWNLVMPK
jgi:hypothetical protein